MGSVKRALKRNAGFLFVLPALLYMLVFVGYPVIKNIILSFQNVTVANLVRGGRSTLWPSATIWSCFRTVCFALR